VVPGSFGWEDVGDFAALADLLPEVGPGLKVLGDDSLVLALASTGLVVAHGGRSVTVLGLEDVVVVDTEDALLVTDRAHAQDVKSVVEALKQTGRAELT
jgi:mannose-1-phosphate guanylyltransferase